MILLDTIAFSISPTVPAWQVVFECNDAVAPSSGARQVHFFSGLGPGRRAPGAQDLQMGCFFCPSAIHWKHRLIAPVIFFNIGGPLFQRGAQTS
jgi:hypothetical protein